CGAVRGAARRQGSQTRRAITAAAYSAARWRPPRFPARAGFAGQYRRQSLEGRACALNRRNADATSHRSGGFPGIAVDPELRLARDEGLARLYVIRAPVAQR